MDRTQMIGYAVLAVVALLYHRLAMAPDRPPRSLVSFGQPGDDEPGTEEDES